MTCILVYDLFPSLYSIPLDSLGIKQYSDCTLPNLLSSLKRGGSLFVWRCSFCLKSPCFSKKITHNQQEEGVLDSTSYMIMHAHGQEVRLKSYEVAKRVFKYRSFVA